MADPQTESVVRAFTPRERLVLSSQLYVGPDDFLRLNLVNAVTNAVFELSGMLMNPAGELKVFLHNVTPVADRSVDTSRFVIGEGVLLHVHLRVLTGTVHQGQCYGTLLVQHGAGSVGTLYTVLINGPVSNQYRQTWPHGSLTSPIEGNTITRLVTGTDPAANTEISETVPTRARWRLRGVTAVLVADATVSPRTPSLIIDDGTTVAFHIHSEFAQSATQTLRWVWGRGLDTQGDVNIELVVRAPLPEVIMLPGWRVRTLTTGMQVGDNWGAPALTVEEWIDT